MPHGTFVLGAVAYDPKVVTIWDGFKAYFNARGLRFDYVLFSTYEAQVAAHLQGVLDAAWNSPLAWVQTRRASATARAVAMRDSDCDLSSAVLVRAEGPKTIAELKGRRVGVGAADSPQATLIPLLHIAEGGLEPGRDFEVIRHDVLLGKHGDHIGGERDAVKALLAGRVDAACVLDGNHLAFSRDGTLPAGSVRVLTQTATYDHCNFTVLADAPSDAFVKLLLPMSWEDPAVRPLLELEGLKAWRPGRVTGYAQLERAVQRFGMPGA
jgi:phosphonate transport system substrate-binding protein